MKKFLSVLKKMSLGVLVLLAIVILINRVPRQRDAAVDQIVQHQKDVIAKSEFAQFPLYVFLEKMAGRPVSAEALAKYAELLKNLPALPETPLDFRWGGRLSRLLIWNREYLEVLKTKSTEEQLAYLKERTKLSLQILNQKTNYITLHTEASVLKGNLAFMQEQEKLRGLKAQSSTLARNHTAEFRALFHEIYEKRSEHMKNAILGERDGVVYILEDAKTWHFAMDDDQASHGPTDFVVSLFYNRNATQNAFYQSAEVFLKKSACLNDLTCEKACANDSCGEGRDLSVRAGNWIYNPVGQVVLESLSVRGQERYLAKTERNYQSIKDSVSLLFSF